MKATAAKGTLALAGAVLVLGGMAGCGGSSSDSGSSAPDSASTDEFCEAFSSLFTEVMAEAGTGDMSKAVSAIKEWAENMQEVGTPDDMPEEARDGFEVFVDAASEIDENATLEDLQDLGGDLSEADQEAGDAFGDWATETCPVPLPGPTDLPSEIASDLPTEMPSDLESMMSDLPSELESMMSDLPTDPSELESMLSELTATAE
jgi:hypothetical protein